MIYVWEEAMEGDTREIIFVLSFDAHQAEKSWAVFPSRDLAWSWGGGTAHACLERAKDATRTVARTQDRLV